MKTKNAKFKYIIIVITTLSTVSCDETNFLKEEPLDFYSLENSYKNVTQFESALTDLYAKVREIHFGTTDDTRHFILLTATDIAKSARERTDQFSSYDVQLTPTNSAIRYTWNSWYKVISNSNTILSRLEESELTDEQKKTVESEARFFRAFAYRYLVYLYGGVPLVLEEITMPKIDFVRASKVEVLNQMVDDFTYAAYNLSSINEVVDGKVSNLVAYHYLAETYISLEKFDEAISAASVVINDTNTGLMTRRFGSRANEDPYDKYLKFETSGDAFWDLFQKGNQNRSAGNKEALWVSQFETDVVGGMLSSARLSGNLLERWASTTAFLTLKDPDGQEGMIGYPLSDYNTGGRGASKMMNTDHFLYTIWESDFDNDIRNASHNIIRDIKYNNPNSAWLDSSVVKYPSQTIIDQAWRWYPYPSKVTTPGQHPDELFEDKDNLLLKSSAGTTYRDMYMLRLAETYLLLAEAYLGKNDKTNAAKNINFVRNRAKASPVNDFDVTLDYILDERARELVYEEQRRLTLHRTGTLVERVRKYNDLNSKEIKDFHGLWPIPYSDIEANIGAVLEQNPGYY